MAAPLSGVGQQQQVPVSQATQPVNTDETRDLRRQDNDPQENQVQLRDAPAAQTQETEVGSRSDAEIFQSLVDNSDNSETSERGSVVDIQV